MYTKAYLVNRILKMAALNNSKFEIPIIYISVSVAENQHCKKSKNIAKKIN